MLKTAITSLLMLPLAAGMAWAQSPDTGTNPNTATTMVCQTSDGTVRITDRAVYVADYRLQLDAVIQDNVLRFIDPSTGATAVLDARESHGLYLEVHEGGATMQLVASAGNIRYEHSDRASEPATPTYSSVLTLLGKSHGNR
ncbi:MAG: hypothetical protein KFF77_07045 [Bacteroidetes bacterium]|nr:hypothetical protein [Bacteroidota bacterium]